MYCTKCGTLVSGDGTYCTGCGTLANEKVEQPKTNTVSNGIVLESSDPLQDNLSKFNYFYWIGIGIGVIFGICTGVVTIPFFVVAFFMLAFAAKGIIAGFRLAELRKMKFQLPMAITPVELTEILANPLSELGMTIKNNKQDICIKYKMKTFYIMIDNTDSTFKVRDVCNASKWVLPSRSDSYRYKLTIVAIPLIAFTVQQVCKIQK